MLLPQYSVQVVDNIMVFIDPINISTLIQKDTHCPLIKKKYGCLMKKNIIQDKRVIDWNPVE